MARFAFAMVSSASGGRTKPACSVRSVTAVTIPDADIGLPVLYACDRLVRSAQEVTEDVSDKRRRYSQIMGYPVCGEYLGDGRICKMGRNHAGSRNTVRPA